MLSVTNALLAASELAIEADMVPLATHAGRVLSATALGHVASDGLRERSCSVLVVPSMIVSSAR